MMKLLTWFLVQFVLTCLVPIKGNYTNTGRYFIIERGKRFTDAETLIYTRFERSQIQCAAKCKTEQICCSATFDKVDGICKLNSKCEPTVEILSSSILIKQAEGKCLRSAIGFEYDGNRNVTPSNRQCQRWDSSYPHLHVHQQYTYWENYCRNPGHDAGGPWCYTMDPAVRWEYCKIPFCERPAQECLESPTGIEYFGHAKRSKSGFICQRWDTQFPHIHTYGYLSDQENNCRNPYGEESSPWCYVVDPIVRWEICDIPVC